MNKEIKNMTIALRKADERCSKQCEHSLGGICMRPRALICEIDDEITRAAEICYNAGFREQVKRVSLDDGLEKSEGEVKKALECCTRTPKCEECPYSGEDCFKLNSDALKVIDALQDICKDFEDKLDNLRVDISAEITKRIKARNRGIMELASSLRYWLTVNNNGNTEYLDYDDTMETINKVAKELTMNERVQK